MPCHHIAMYYITSLSGPILGPHDRPTRQASADLYLITESVEGYRVMIDPTVTTASLRERERERERGGGGDIFNIRKSVLKFFQECPILKINVCCGLMTCSASHMIVISQ